MPRRPNTKPTNIYWLYDIRPETITLQWPNGKPFYCGKTVDTAEKRFSKHRGDAIRRPHRPLSKLIQECGAEVHVETIEIVPAADDWIAREKHWIKILRGLNPNCLNVSDGGEGNPGVIHSETARRRMSAAKSNCRPETRKKLRDYACNRPAEVLAKIGAASRGRVDSEETRKRRSESQTGKVRSAETRELIRTLKLNQSAETRRKISDAKRGFQYSPEALASIREGQRRRRLRESAAKIPPLPY